MNVSGRDSTPLNYNGVSSSGNNSRNNESTEKVSFFNKIFCNLCLKYTERKIGELTEESRRMDVALDILKKN
ncbi:MAG: hypothetical protein VX777_04750 [Chlamydiota bacterium]|nr:hypothetical protein [Chlamydiota bacterium]